MNPRLLYKKMGKSIDECETLEKSAQRIRQYRKHVHDEDPIDDLLMLCRQVMDWAHKTDNMIHHPEV
jgi:hypothetical protein